MSGELSVILPELSDPESASRFGLGIDEAGFSYEADLACQLKLSLALYDQIILPAGFLFDNPAIWRLLKDRGFLEVLTRVNGSNQRSDALIVALRCPSEVNVESIGFDTIFDYWRRGLDGHRILSPSSVRTRGVIASMGSEEATQWLSSNSNRLVPLDEYADRLGLEQLKSSAQSLQNIVDNATRVVSPPGRYEYLRRMVSERCDIVASLVEEPDRMIWKSLKAMALNETAKPFTRSKIQQQLGQEGWNLVSPIVSSWRRQPYIDSLPESYSTCSAFDNYGAMNVTSELWSELKKLEREEETASECMGWTVLIENLSFGDILEMRENIEFRESSRSIASFDVSDEISSKDIVRQYSANLAKNWAPRFIELVNEVNPKALVKSGKSKDTENTATGFITTAAGGGIAAAAASVFAPAFAPVAATGAAFALLSGLHQRYISPNSFRPTRRILIRRLRNVGMRA